MSTHHQLRGDQAEEQCQAVVSGGFLLNFLAMNILWSRDANAIDVPPQTTTEMKAWFLAYKSHLADYAASGTSVATEKPDLGIEKQQLRRAA